MKIKLIANDELGSWCLKVSGGPNASGSEEVSMATLETGTTLKQPLTGTVTLKEKLSGDTYLRKYLPDKYPDPAPPPPRGRVERERETVASSKKDPLRSASKAKQHCKGHKSREKHEGQQGPEGRPEGHVLRRRRPLANPLGFNFA